MPILAPLIELRGPAPRPLVAHLLTPPKDPRTGRAVALNLVPDRPGRPVETEGGLIWTTPVRTWTSKGEIALTIPDGQGVWANLSRRWWCYETGTGAGLMDAATGTVRVVPRAHSPVEDSGIDDRGVPVGLREWEGAVYGRPCHGETPLKLPAEFVDSPAVPSGVVAAPKGTVIAGALTTGSAESPHTLPFVWANDEAEPRALPRPDGYDQAIVSALNSRGDVAGLIGGRGLPNRAVIWRADGTIAHVPVGAWNAGRSLEGGPSAAAEPRLLTEDGVLIGRETSKDAPWGFVTTYWDGRRTLWFPDAVAGVRIVNLESLRLTADGRGFLAHVWNGKAWGWYRISPR